MEFTATVVNVQAHDKLTDVGARVKYKDVVTLTINAPPPPAPAEPPVAAAAASGEVVVEQPPVAAATQPISTVAGTLELHVPADEEWEELIAGDQVTVSIVPVDEAAVEARKPAVVTPPGEVPAPLPAAGVTETAPTVEATPAAQAHAEATGVDLTAVEGTGAGGKVTKADVEEAAKAQPVAAETPAEEAAEEAAETEPAVASKPTP